MQQACEIASLVLVDVTLGSAMSKTPLCTGHFPRATLSDSGINTDAGGERAVWGNPVSVVYAALRHPE